jgi:hypothetical protein
VFYGVSEACFGSRKKIQNSQSAAW